MSRNLRSSHNSPKPKPVSRADELDDLLAAPSLKPNLRFLGLRDDITNITAAPGDINQYGFLGPSVDDLRSVGAGNPAPFDLAARSIPTASPAVIAEGLISDVNAQTGESPLSAGPILIPSPAVINDAPQADANAQTEERRPPSPRPVLITSPAVTPSPAVIKRQTHPLPSLPSPAVIAGDYLLASPAIINDAPQADANAQTEERRPPSPRPVLITSPAVTPSPAVIKRQTHPLPSLPSPAVIAGDYLLASPAIINDAPQADANAQTEERRPPSPRPVLITSPAVTPSPAVIKRQTHPLPSLPSPAVIAGDYLLASPAIINDAPQADANAQTEERRPPSPRPVLITSPAVTPSPAVIKRQTHPLPSLPSPAVIAGDDLLASPAIINDAPQADANAQTEERRPPSPRPVLITSPAVTPSPAVIKRQTHPLP